MTLRRISSYSRETNSRYDNELVNEHQITQKQHALLHFDKSLHMLCVIQDRISIHYSVLK